jgi:hypothetical protein
MVETKYNTSHHAGSTPEARINSRLRNSGDPSAEHVVKRGDGPTRTFHNIHEAGHKIQPGTAAKSTDGRVASVAESKKQQSGAG